jgi:hypothetical protein
LLSVRGLSEEPAIIAGDFELFEGTSWKYPKLIRLAAFDEAAATRIGEKMVEQFVLEGVQGDVDLELFYTTTATATNRTEFLEDCQATIDASSTASEEVCVYLDAMDNYTIFYGGKEDVSPFQLALAGTQWAVNSALLAVNATAAAQQPLLFPVSNIQRAPKKVSESDYQPITIVLLLPPIMHVLACAVATQFMIGPITYEKVNHVTESFLFVGVKMRTYLFQSIGYYSINLTLTAVILTVVSEYWNLMPYVCERTQSKNTRHFCFSELCVCAHRFCHRVLFLFQNGGLELGWDLALPRFGPSHFTFHPPHAIYIPRRTGARIALFDWRDQYWDRSRIAVGGVGNVRVDVHLECPVSVSRNDAILRHLYYLRLCGL